jgi:hypothetical protein
MYEDADRARMHGLAAAAKALERQQRRPVRIDGDGAELSRKAADDTLRPAIERVRQSVVRLCRIREESPLHASGEAQQHDGASAHSEQLELAGLGMKSASDRESDCFGAPT